MIGRWYGAVKLRRCERSRRVGWSNFFFFFKGSAPPRNLPSSPTRPSPDPRREAARPRRDKDAVVIATRAQAAVNYHHAAKAVSEGRFQEAERDVKANNYLFDDATVAGEIGRAHV